MLKLLYNLTVSSKTNIFLKHWKLQAVCCVNHHIWSATVSNGLASNVLNRVSTVPAVFVPLDHPYIKLPFIDMADNRFGVDYDKRGQASCKKCKQKIGKGFLRLAKITANPFTEGEGEMKNYFHPMCLFDTFLRARATTKVIEDCTDLEGYTDIEQKDKDEIQRLISEISSKKGNKGTTPKKTPKKEVKDLDDSTPKKKTLTPLKEQRKKIRTPQKATEELSVPSTSCSKETKLETSQNDDDEPAADQDAASSTANKDDYFRQFRKLCADIAEESSYLGKTKIISDYLKSSGTEGGFQGDVYLLLKLLLPGVVKTVYNLNSKQLIKLFGQLFGADAQEMSEHLEQGDVAETVKVFFEQSTKLKPQTASTLTLQQVDKLLYELSQYSKEEDQLRVLRKMAVKSTANDLKMIVRLIKHDLRINAGAKHVLDALDPRAYEAFQASRNLRDVVDRVQELRSHSPGGLKKKLSIKASLMTPVLPMLAEACKSVEQAFKRCPNGMYAEIKYDGERVQVHKQGNQFQYYSRSLKPVLPHKVQHFKDWIPKAFPTGGDLILDSEVLLIDTNTSKPLPFGSLGVHKKSQFSDANVCLFVFDCLHYNGQSLMEKPITERKKILEQNMTEITNHIMFSEKHEITKPKQLRNLMVKVFNEGLEGLVLKDYQSTYEPGKRHWLKVKKDYLAEGSMADTADLIVLGAYFGTGNKGGMMSVFLMGCYDSVSHKFVTVTKCSGGFDDAALAKLQKELSMVKISKDYSKVPKWLSVNRAVVPDFVVTNPKEAPVWEITGAEFTRAEIHTADGISIRFPRCTKMRDDKTWKEATDLDRLKELFKVSKERSDFEDLLGAPKSSPPSPPTEFKQKTTESSRKRKLLDTSDSSVESPTKKLHTDATLQNNTVTRATTKTQVICKGLPSVFQGLKFYISPCVVEHRRLCRYITAYNGDLLAKYEKGTAQYVVVEKKGSSKASTNEISVQHLWECIKNKKVPKL